VLFLPVPAMIVVSLLTPKPTTEYLAQFAD
jgi:hypothetical protein